MARCAFAISSLGSEPELALCLLEQEARPFRSLLSWGQRTGRPVKLTEEGGVS